MKIDETMKVVEHLMSHEVKPEEHSDESLIYLLTQFDGQIEIASKVKENASKNFEAIEAELKRRKDIS